MTLTKVQLENHETRIKELESHDGKTLDKVQQILEVRLPSIERSIESLSVKVTNMTALNFITIVIGVILSKLLK